jgi:hypothetical protein
VQGNNTATTMNTSILSLLLFLVFGSASAIDIAWSFNQAGYPALEIQEGDTVTFSWQDARMCISFAIRALLITAIFTKADLVCDTSPCEISDLDDDGKFHFFGCSIGRIGSPTHCSNPAGNMKLEVIVTKDESDSDSGD